MAKAGKLRPCPALGREISPGECGEDRNRRQVCPADCAYNPFNPAAYDSLREVEDELDGKTLRWMAEDARDRLRFQQELATAASADPSTMSPERDVP